MRFSRKPAALGLCRLASAVRNLPGASIFAMRSFGVEGGGAEKRAFLQERFCRSVFAGAFLQECFCRSVFAEACFFLRGGLALDALFVC